MLPKLPSKASTNLGAIQKAARKLKRDYNTLRTAVQESRLQEQYKAHASDTQFDWDWGTTHFNRIALVNSLIGETSSDSPRYLEIGCCDNALFDSVAIDNKIGVDPDKGGTHRMTSDEFFEQNSETFDIVFIDGLHEYEQVRRDAINSLACLAPGGFVAFHDFLPRTWKEHHVPRLQSAWTGDCWKSAYELSKTDGVDFKIVMIDHGVGILRKTKENPVVVDQREQLADKQFDFFAEIVDDLPLLDWSEFLVWLRHRK